MASTAIKIVKPIAIDDTNLTSTNVSENPPEDWVSAASYSVLDDVVRPSLHKIYSCVTAHTGVTTAPELDNINWVYKSPSNPYAMFDGSNSTQTENSDIIDVTITPGTIVNTLYLSNVDALDVDVIVTDPVAGTLPTQNYPMKSSIPSASWYYWHFTTRTYKKSLVVDLPSYRNASVRVKINKPSSTAKCGTLVIGKAFLYGDGIEFGAGAGITSYSVNQTDQFGNRNVVKRGYSNKANWNAWVPSGQVDPLNDLLVSLRDEVTLYIGTSKYQMMSVLGFIKIGEPVITYEDYCIFNMQIEGVS